MPPVRPIEGLWAGMLARKESYESTVFLFTHGFVVGGNGEYVISGKYRQQEHLVFGTFDVLEHPFSKRYDRFFGEDECPVVDFELDRHFRPDFQYFGAGIVTNSVDVPEAFTIGLKPMESFPDYVLDTYDESLLNPQHDESRSSIDKSQLTFIAYLRELVGKRNNR